MSKLAAGCLIEACRQMAEWHASRNALSVSVNVSGRQLDHDVIVDDVRDTLGAERASSHHAHCRGDRDRTDAQRQDGRAPSAIKSLGCSWRSTTSVRGTRLSPTPAVPVDCLKIDRTFTNAITTSPESKALIGTLVQLGRDLGLRTLAEGVETTEEMDRLRDEHVDEAQGFLLARPLDASTWRPNSSYLLGSTAHARR